MLNIMFYFLIVVLNTIEICSILKNFDLIFLAILIFDLDQSNVYCLLYFTQI